MGKAFSSPLFTLFVINVVIVAIFIIALKYIKITQRQRCQISEQANNKDKNDQKNKPKSTETSTMPDDLRNRLNSLLTVKSLVTLILTEVFAYLAIACRIDKQQFMTVYSVIIAFYFGTQVQKNQDVAKTVSGKKTESTVDQKQE